MNLRPKIGLALGGGGARGAAHLGVLKHFESIGLRPDCIAGTSAGAVVAALYAFGVSLEQIDREMRLCKPIDFSGFRFKSLGLFENNEIAHLLTKLLPKDALIEQANIPLAIKATNLLTGHGVILQSGPVIPAVLASCCVPGVYIAQEINGLILVDGALTENVPLTALKKLGAHFMIAVNLNGNEGYTPPQGVVDVISSSLDIAIDAQTRRQLRDAHALISMDLTGFSRTSSEHFDELVATGFNSAKEVVSSAKMLQTWFHIKRFYLLMRDFLPVKIPAIFKKWLGIVSE